MSGDQRVSEEFELVLFSFKKILKYHGTLSRVLRDQIEAHIVVIGTGIFVAEAFFLAQGIDVAQGLAA